MKSASSNWAWLGVPDQQGVIHVGGRIGAAEGPAAAWRIFQRLNGQFPVREQLSTVRTVDGLGLDINANHARAAAVVSMLQNTHARTVVLGGGHDIGFPHLQGVRDALSERMGREARIGCINLDAHLDVRKPAPLRTSGSPFYLAIEEKVLEPTDLIEFGIQSHCNGPALWKYVQELGVKVIPFSDLRTPGSAFRAFQGALLALESRCDAIVISLDLDCIEQASAPGVSAPQAEGFRPMDIIELLEHAGRSPKVISLGVFELNPLLDHDDMTARIAATAAWHFIEAGLVGTTA